MDGDLVAWACGGEARLEGVESGEDDEVDHEPDGGTSRTSLHHAVEGAWENDEGLVGACE